MEMEEEEEEVVNQGAVELGSAFATCRHSITSHALSLSLASILLLLCSSSLCTVRDRGYDLIASMLAGERQSAELADLEARALDARCGSTEVIGIYMGASASTR